MVLVPFLTLLALLLNLLQIGLQVLDIVLVFCPLLLGQNGFCHGQMQGTNYAIVALIVQFAWKAADCFFNILVFIETIVTVQTLNDIIHRPLK